MHATGCAQEIFPDQLRLVPGSSRQIAEVLGSSDGDGVGGAITAFTDVSQAMANVYWNNSDGAITCGSGTFELRGTVQPWNSVIGQVSAAPQPAPLNFSCDAANKQLVVGRPAENIVGLSTPVQVFSDGFNRASARVPSEFLRRVGIR